MASDDALDEFMEELFNEYAGAAENGGHSLMNNTALRHFFRDFFGSTGPEGAVARADLRYADEIQRQMDICSCFGLTRVQAKKGLCFRAFICLLDRVVPRGISRSFARQRFDEYSGNAHEMRAQLAG